MSSYVFFPIGKFDLNLKYSSHISMDMVETTKKTEYNVALSIVLKQEMFFILSVSSDLVSMNIQENNQLNHY